MMKNIDKIDKLSISSWNINGLGQKYRDEDFLNQINYDINIILETWKGDCPDIDVPNYVSFSKCRKKNKRAKRSSGGIIVYCKKEIIKGITYLKNLTKSENRMWLKLDKNFFGIEYDIYICGVYIPPINSPHYEDEYQKLEGEINLLTNKGKIFLTGDFNSRSNIYPDFIVDDDNNENLSNILPDNYKSDYFLPRKSLDKVINNQGRALLDLCASARLRILNGRFIGDLLGYFTCINSRGSSVVDYAVASVDLLSSVKYFNVKNPTHFSDHSQLVTYFECNLKPYTNRKEYKKQNFSFQWTKMSKRLLLDRLEDSKICESIINFQTTDFEKSESGVNNATEFITNVYFDLSKNCMINRSFQKKRKKPNSPWTDSEFFSLRSTVNSLSQKLKKYPYDLSLKNKFLYYVKSLKRMSKIKKREYKEKIFDKIRNLSPEDSNEFWKVLKSLNKKENRGDENLAFDLDILTKHFQTQGEPSGADENFQFFINDQLKKKEQNLINDYKDNPIKVSEIKSIIKKLKKGKSTGPDLICYEIIKNSSHVLLTALTKFFNLIFETTIYPKGWEKAYIIPLFKGGNPNDPCNYRGISLLNCLSKIFNAVIKNRLVEKFEDIMNPNQFGFRKNSRTSDCIFVLKTIINKYVYNNKQKVYGCFIDLKKAFDSVWRTGLLYKLTSNNKIGYNLYNVIKNMYKHTEFCVKNKAELSEYLLFDRGVKQGDSLSPNLFNIYINDLPDIFDNSCEPVIMEKLSTNCLMFADDLLLLSETPDGLQNSLNKLFSYCHKWQLSININKTKCITFQQRNIIDKNNDFFLNGQKIEQVLKYKYLGNIVEASGKFHSSHL